MQKTLWWFAILVLLAALGCAQPETLPPAGTEQSEATPGVKKSQPASAPAQAGTQPLFIIARNTNANVVHYDAQLTADGKLDRKKPVIAYWVMLAQDGHRENLNWIEKKMAYGFNIKPYPSVNGYQMTIVAARQRSITVKKVGNAVRAEIVIDGRTAILEKMYIEASGHTVRYLELYGKDVQTGGKRFERIIPK
jgi:hypothetical protein